MVHLFRIANYDNYYTSSTKIISTAPINGV